MAAWGLMSKSTLGVIAGWSQKPPGSQRDSLQFEVMSPDFNFGFMDGFARYPVFQASEELSSEYIFLTRESQSHRAIF